MYFMLLKNIILEDFVMNENFERTIENVKNHLTIRLPRL